jgi:hypothetical protein
MLQWLSCFTPHHQRLKVLGLLVGELDTLVNPRQHLPATHPRHMGEKNLSIHTG